MAAKALIALQASADLFKAGSGLLWAESVQEGLLIDILRRPANLTEHHYHLLQKLEDESGGVAS